MVLGCMADAFYALWEPRRLLLLPLIYFGPYALFRWAGKHDPQWSEVYPKALANRAIFYAHSDPQQRERAPVRRVIFRRPRYNA